MQENKQTNYTLKAFEKGDRTLTMGGAITSLKPILGEEVPALLKAFVAVIVNSGALLLAPFMISYVIDNFIPTKDYGNLYLYSGILFFVFLVAFVTQYAQTMVMGGVGRRVLFKLRNRIFHKLQSLPVAFFNSNKAGDLISRINNDTDKLNQFFSQVLVQFFGNLIMMIGAAIFMIYLNAELGFAALIPAIIVVIITRLLSPWINYTSRKSLQALGNLSAEIQESLANFKVVLVFNRLDYFRVKFEEANQENYKAALKSGVASSTLIPIYGIASNIAQILVLAIGIIMISQGTLTIGLLVGFLLYLFNFYMPLRQLAQMWTSLQTALASLDRIGEVFKMENTLTVIPETNEKKTEGILSFENVHFGYGEKEILHKVNFTLEKGKTYALVGPTGGGKTTTASIMARLYDPNKGRVYLDGKDVRSYDHNERTKKIGFILQEPFLFTGTIAENITYGNDDIEEYTQEELTSLIKETGLDNLLSRFPEGLQTKVGSSDSISLGQKQIIAFMRAVLRKPELLILDEATANIDTVTEQVLEDILKKLPQSTTKVIIAHRLNTIKNADDIFFVNSGNLTHAGSFDHALEMLLHGKRTS